MIAKNTILFWNICDCIYRAHSLKIIFEFSIRILSTASSISFFAVSSAKTYRRTKMQSEFTFVVFMCLLVIEFTVTSIPTTAILQTSTLQTPTNTTITDQSQEILSNLIISFTIINAPEICKPWEQIDQKGICRIVWTLKNRKIWTV